MCASRLPVDTAGGARILQPPYHPKITRLRRRDTISQHTPRHVWYEKDRTAAGRPLPGSAPAGRRVGVDVASRLPRSCSQLSRTASNLASTDRVRAADTVGGGAGLPDLPDQWMTQHVSCTRHQLCSSLNKWTLWCGLLNAQWGAAADRAATSRGSARGEPPHSATTLVRPTPRCATISAPAFMHKGISQQGAATFEYAPSASVGAPRSTPTLGTPRSSGYSGMLCSGTLSWMTAQAWGRPLASAVSTREERCTPS